jgi:hypothetical protein
MSPHTVEVELRPTDSQGRNFKPHKTADNDPYSSWEKRRTKQLWDALEAKRAAERAANNPKIVQQ